MKLGTYLKQWRTDRYLNQTEMAKLIGVSLTTYNFIENNKTQPHPQTFDSICLVLGTTKEKLLKKLGVK